MLPSRTETLRNGGNAKDELHPMYGRSGGGGDVRTA